MNDDFIAWLIDKAQEGVCFNCNGCPFNSRQNGLTDCDKLTIEQKREILMKIYESEVNTDASNN